MESRSRDDELRRTRVELGAMRLTARQLSSALENEKEVNARLSARLTRADTKLQLLVGVAHSMEEDRRSLMSHVTSLLGQYHELLSNSMEDKEFFHSQEKIFLERLNGLMRQKENLEQKIMDHYRRLDSCSAKKKGFGSSFVKKVRKAGSDIINKVPRARSRSRTATDEADTSLASETGPRESEHSSDETVSEHGGLGADSDTDTSMSLGSVGTRRAIYYDEPTTPSTTAANATDATNETTEPKERNLLVFNKVSAVIGTTNHQLSPVSPPSQPALVQNHTDQQPTSGEQKTESSVWYEYGCV